jgi:hypothetical protein
VELPLIFSVHPSFFWAWVFPRGIANGYGYHPAVEFEIGLHLRRPAKALQIMREILYIRMVVPL